MIASRCECEDPVVSVRNLHVRVVSGDTDIEPVRGISFDIGPGEAVGLVGESGSGKTLTSLSLMGLLPKGQAWLEADTLDITGIDMRQNRPAAWRRIRGSHVAMVFQEPMTSLNPVMRVGSQLTEAVRAHRKILRGAAKREVLQSLRDVDIRDPWTVYRHYPHQLSGGMRQRVMIAMALSCQAKLIVADEPTTALDVSTQATVLDLLQNVARDHGTALLLVSHDLGVVARMTRRVIVMYAGTVVETGTTQELFANPRHPYTAALLASIPRMGDRLGTRLAAIPGNAPAVDQIPDGCPFAPRCSHRITQCEIRPALTAGDEQQTERRDPDDQHLFACWNPVPAADPASRTKVGP